LRKEVLAGLIILALLVLAAIPMKAMKTNSVTQLSLSNSAAKFVPSMVVPAGVDKDHNGVADSLDQEIGSRAGLASSLAEDVNVTVMLKAAPTTSD
jgi:hypothetical protein